MYEGDLFHVLDMHAKLILVNFWFIQIIESFSDHVFEIKFGPIWEINFGPLFVFDATMGSKMDQNLFFDTFKVEKVNFGK